VSLNQHLAIEGVVLSPRKFRSKKTGGSAENPAIWEHDHAVSEAPVPHADMNETKTILHEL
jgi:hypothetical protein